MPARRILVALVLFTAPAAWAADPAPPDKPSPEEKILHKAGVPTDDAGLLAFFRGRTLDDAEQKRIDELIRRLGGDDFDDREAAYKELRRIGARARPLIQAAAHGPDQETALRAQRWLVDVAPFPREPVMAAARLLARRAPSDAVPVLLAFLPFADHELVEEQVFAALLALSPDGAKVDPALAGALDDPQPIKRAAAAYVLGRKGDKDQQAAVRKRLEDADAKVRWEAAAALLAAHDRAAVPTLVSLLADGPLETAARSEEVLFRLAGERAPAVALGDAAQSRGKCRDAWSAWWKENGGRCDLARYEEAPPQLGYTLGVEYNTGRVWECDIDGAIRWEIRDLAGPMDGQVLPDGHVLVADAEACTITERDINGSVLWQKKTEGRPNDCRRLPDGSTFVSTCNAMLGHYESRAMEYSPDGTLVYCIKLGTGSNAYNAVRKGRDGFIYYSAGWTLSAMNTAGKSRCDEGGAAWGVPLPKDGALYASLEELPGDRCLVTDSRNGRVLEVRTSGDVFLPANLTDEQRAMLLDSGLKGGAVLWQADVPACCGAARLPNGHTLVGVNHKVIELGADGKPLWQVDTDGYVRRVYRR